METEKKQPVLFKITKKILTLFSWVIFVVLLFCAAILAYYFIATKVYMVKGKGYEPKFNLYTIVSPSMTPNIKVYDVIVDFKVNNPEDIQVGDVITFNTDNPELAGNSITHRVISIKQENGTYLYQTKGDANLVEDASLVPYKDVIGRVAFKIPQLGRVQFFIASTMGWMLVILAPALYIIIKNVLKLTKVLKMDDKPSGKVKEFLNKPVLTGKTPRLLSYTPSVHDGNYNVLINTDDEIDEDDLPSLK